MPGLLAIVPLILIAAASLGLPGPGELNRQSPGPCLIEQVNFAEPRGPAAEAAFARIGVIENGTIRLRAGFAFSDRRGADGGLDIVSRQGREEVVIYHVNCSCTSQDGACHFVQATHQSGVCGSTNCSACGVTITTGFPDPPNPR